MRLQILEGLKRKENMRQYKIQKMTGLYKLEKLIMLFL